MFRNSHKLPRQLAAAVAVVALAVPATSSAYTDPGLRSPDAQDAGIKAQQEQPGYQNLRSPDATDDRQVIESPAPAETASSQGFDWGDAGIGAGAVLGLVFVSLSVMFTVVHRRNRTATT
jgi:hypothetical protein